MFDQVEIARWIVERMQSKYGMDARTGGAYSAWEVMTPRMRKNAILAECALRVLSIAPHQVRDFAFSDAQNMIKWSLAKFGDSEVY